MEKLFDAFSKSLAESVSRRESLRRLGAVFAGAALSALGLAAARGAHNQNGCWDDEDCPWGLACCSGVCTNLDFDNANCGACGVVCPDGYSCQGQCVPIDPDAIQARPAQPVNSFRELSATALNKSGR